MVESRDNSTGGHIRRTSEGVKIFVEQLMKPENNKWHFTESFCKNLIKAAPMHDLGKIAIPDHIPFPDGDRRFLLNGLLHQII